VTYSIGKRITMEKISIVCILLCLIVSIFSSGCLEDDNDTNRIMSFKELANDYVVEKDNNTKIVIQNFLSLNDTDTVIIQDSITNISYNQVDNYTLIEFGSNPGESLTVAGDITHDFGPGDTIEIPITIGVDVFMEENPYTGEMWTYDMEVMREAWDNETHEYGPFPQQYFHHVNPADKTVTMTFEEFADDITSDYNNQTKTATYWFRSLNDGDTVIVHDTIHNISYSESEDYTHIEFNSRLGNSFAIQGDITDDFSPGDTIEIKMHIISLTFTQRNTNTNEDWTIKMETMKEGWDMENNEYIPIPRKYVTKVTRDKGEAITMTFNEFMTGYGQNIDNQSRIITIYFQNLNPGDTLIIKDTINTITYNETRGYTGITFTSYATNDFPIDGDITDKFTPGDMVEITVHVISTSFTQQHPSTGETWTFNLEVLEEEWDDATQTFTVFPADCIQHA